MILAMISSQGRNEIHWKGASLLSSWAKMAEAARIEAHRLHVFQEQLLSVTSDDWLKTDSFEDLFSLSTSFCGISLDISPRSTRHGYCVSRWLRWSRMRLFEPRTLTRNSGELRHPLDVSRFTPISSRPVPRWAMWRGTNGSSVSFHGLWPCISL